MHRAIRIALSITFCWFLSGFIAGAQESSPSPSNPGRSPVPTPSPLTTPIPLSEIAVQAQATAESLSVIQNSLSTDQITATVEERLPRLTNEIALRTAELTKLLAGKLPLEFFHYMGAAAQRLNDELSTWNRDLTEHAKTLDNQIAHLEKLSNIWKSTLQLPQLSKAAPEIPKRVQDLINEIGRTQQAVESVRERDLALQGRILEATAQLQITASAVERAQASAVRNLFVQDSPPIWSLRVSDWTQEYKAPAMWQASLSVGVTYIKHHWTAFLVHALIIFVLFFVIRWLRGRVHKWTEGEPSLRRAAPVFDLPVSTPITLSFLITGRVYALAPSLLRAILGGVLLVPTALILRRLIDRRLFPIVNALLIFYFVEQLGLIATTFPLSVRFLSAAEMLGGTLFLIWLTRSKHLPTVGADTTKLFARAIRFATQIGLVVFPVTLLANVFGYVNLANLLGTGALRSAFIAAALYAALRIVEGLVIISLGVGPVASMRVVRLNRSMLRRRICGVAEVLAFVYWLSLTLEFFRLRTPLIETIEAVLETNLTIGSLNMFLGHILVFLVAIWASFALSRFVRFLLEEDVYHHWQLARGIPQAISTMVHYGIVLMGFFLGLAALGVDLTKVTILAGAFTVGVGFGLQTVINNFVCGIILLFERPIKVGDVVQIDADVGEVRRIGIRACVIRTADGSEVIVPNGTIIANKVTNWTFSDRYRAVEVSVTVARGVAAHRVVEILKNVAANHPTVAKEPEPQAYVVNLATAAVTFQLRAWTDRYEDWIQVRSDLSVAVDAALTRENIMLA